ncbi:MAG TPA: HD-GYP domain-containing protein [Candidatus Aerophobetes bacterium]|uniref:HD-GYP domain-containing protein n=1 Tax=Aerophobetes bacterium TaxID=2030807 RepID=A0A662DFL5_UNCAE|nr:MAG: hypothetical protein DRI96_03745 [Candidatus Aerophobetes bacterium]HDN84619.1 HD-GYP domain-containing protein [Candidatus Aerophobetes bacterium]
MEEEKIREQYSQENSLRSRTRRVSFYIALVTGIGIALLIFWSWGGTLNWEMEKGFIFWMVLILIAESFSVSLPYGGSVTLGFPVIYATLLTQGPIVGVWVAACGSLTELKKGKRTDVRRMLFDLGESVISTSGAWLVYTYTGGIIIKNVSSAHIIPIGLAALVFFAINSFTVSTILALQKGTSIIDMWSNNFRWVTPNYLAQTPLGFLMAVIYRQISWWAVIFVMLPLFIAYWAYRLHIEMEREHISIIQALATAVEARDPYTEKHSRRMAEYAVATARELGLSIYESERIRYATILHDIGKIGVSDRILSKNGPLTREEWEEIKKHSVIGAEILTQINSFSETSKLVYHHHERYNGTGYPNGLKGEEIPIGSRIIAVVDAYDAMVSRRPYREAMSKEEAIAELKKNAGKQFDKKVVEAFLRVIGRNAT